MQIKKIPYRGFVVAALVLNLLSIVTFFILKSFLPPVVPFLYGRPSGEGQLVPTVWLLAAPLVSLFLTILNVVVSGLTGDIFAKKLLVATAFLLSLLTTITLLKIIFLIGFF